jgi:hypothetical protein
MAGQATIVENKYATACRLTDEILVVHYNGLLSSTR